MSLHTSNTPLAHANTHERPKPDRPTFLGSLIRQPGRLEANLIKGLRCVCVCVEGVGGALLQFYTFIVAIPGGH